MGSDERMSFAFARVTNAALLLACLLGGACDAAREGASGTDPSGAGTPDAAVATPDAAVATRDASATSSLVERVAFAQLHAADAPATFTWYRDVLGLPPATGMTFVVANHSTFEILPGGTASATVKDHSGQSIALGFRVPSLEVAATTLEARGFAFLLPTDGVPGEGRWRYFVDPEGNRMELVDIGTPRDGFGYETLEWVGVYAQDMPLMRAWYEKLLGPPTAVAVPFYVVFYLKDGSVLELQSGGAATPSGKAPDTQALTVGLEVTSVAEAVATLEARGVGATTSSAAGARAELIDPEGTRWILTEP